MNTKYIISIVALLAVIHYLLAGSAPLAMPARVAPQAGVGPVAPSSVAPNASAAPVSPIGPPPPAAAQPPVASSPIAPVAPNAPIPPQSIDSNSPAYPYAYTYTYGSNRTYFTNGIPRAYLRDTNSVHWATNQPYGNPVDSYTNGGIRTCLPYQRIAPIRNASFPTAR
ncbi:MAG TPA: hypothetical protein VGY56_16630 [Verrucomicrobiae bacterium]|nr:hypothetical protein [Verrucomicrobiae bacterium]